MPNKSGVVSEEEDNSNDTMEEVEEGYNEGVWMDREEEPPDELMYNGECKKNCCINREHAEDSFEVSNRNIKNGRSEIRNKIAQ